MASQSPTVPPVMSPAAVSACTSSIAIPLSDVVWHSTIHREKSTMNKHESTMELVPRKRLHNQRVVLTPKQLRAARVFLGWSRAKLSRESGIPVRTIENFEADAVTPLLTTAGKLRRTLEDAGVIFLDPNADHGPGIILKEGRRTPRKG